MLKIRLSRVGRKNRAQFRVTVSDSRRAPDGKFIEILGHYDPFSNDKVFNKDRVEYWISKGAQPSPTIHNFLIDAGIIKGEKVTVWKPKKKEGSADAKKAEAVAPSSKPAVAEKPKEAKVDEKK